MTFSELHLRPQILRALEEKGYTSPTPIQAKAIPFILTGKDLMAGSQTGTGKTAGFTLPLLEKLMSAPGTRQGIRALILTPTRELGAQVEESVREYGKYLPLRSTVIFGGVSQEPQIARLRKGIDILVATPGRLLDLIQQKVISLANIQTFVLDEADRMLDMGFIHDIRKVLNYLPPKRQNLLFSATFAPEVKKLADDLLSKPHMIETTTRNSAGDRVSQVVHPVDSNRKKDLLSHLILTGRWEQVLVFTRTKHGANRLGAHLEKEGISNGVIHGNKSQGARTKALAGFKDGSTRVLVATDIAARGIDIDMLPFVVNFDLPSVPEDYVHRIGRTGRAGKEGKAISLVCIDEEKLLRGIEKMLKKPLPKEVVEGFMPDPTIAAKPIPNGRNKAKPPFKKRSFPSHPKRSK